MKSLLAIFLATALLVGCGETTTSNEQPAAETFSAQEWEDLFEWCIQNRYSAQQDCGKRTDQTSQLIEDGMQKDCLVRFMKRLISTESRDDDEMEKIFNECKFYGR